MFYPDVLPEISVMNYDKNVINMSTPIVYKPLKTRAA